MRCSTEQQDEASQRQQIASWFEGKESGPDVWIIDHASGGKPWQKRKLLDVLDAAIPGDYIVVSEVSRIARSTLGVLSFLEAAADKRVSVVAVRSKLILDDSLHSKITVTVLALAAEIERDLLRERTKAALDARRQAGLPLGRPRGSKSDSMLTSRRPEIERCLKAGVSKRAIARMLNCAPGTLYAYLSSQGIAVSQGEAQDLAESTTS
jgi:DNA invertase Pin-like site-specific DNA recombinase